MKIVTNTTKNGESIYIQVKDLLYLGRTLGDVQFIDEYVKMLNLQKSDYDFIRVYGVIAKTVLQSDIVDFKEIYNEPIMLLTKTLINLSFTGTRDETTKQRCEDIRDVLSFRRGELDYNIPLLSDGDLEFISNDGLLAFSSTIISDCYVLKTIDGSDINGIDSQEFLSYCLDRLKLKYGERIGQIYDINNMFVIKFSGLGKGKKSNKLKFLKLKKDLNKKGEE